MSHMTVVNQRLAALLQPEVYGVLQVMKLHGTTGKYFSDDSSLLRLAQTFVSLRRRLRQLAVTETENLTAADAFFPFITLLRSGEANLPILTSVIDSLIRMINSQIFEYFNSEDVIIVFRQIVLAIIEFNYGENPEDKFVYRLITLMKATIERFTLFDCISAQELCSLVERLFNLMLLNKISEYSKRHAEDTCLILSSHLFEKLKQSADFDNEESNTEVIKLHLPGKKAEKEQLPPALAQLEADLAAVAAEAKPESEKSSPNIMKSSLIRSPSVTPSILGVETIKNNLMNLTYTPPFTSRTILNLLEYVLEILEEGDSVLDRLKPSCLNIVANFIDYLDDEFVERFTLAWKLVETKLSRCLIQSLSLSEVNQNIPSLHHAILSLFGRFRRRLMCQMELLLVTISNQLEKVSIQGTKNISPYRVSKEIYLELLAHFLLDPSFLADVYVSFECGVRFGFTLSNLLRSLCKVALLDPKSTGPNDSSSYILAIDILIIILKLLDFSTAVSPTSVDSSPNGRTSELSSIRALKEIHQKSALLFNKDPKEAFAFLVEQKLMDESPNPEEIAHFLRRTPGLDKRVVGELVSKPSNLDLLKEFINGFKLAGLEIDEALRVVLESFRLPGEAQQISRIMEAVASAYYKASPLHQEIFKSEDAVYVLAYSIVMLNTDQHNRQVRHRMTVEDWIRNNRGINDGANFDENFLIRVYNAIKAKEIVLPEEQSGETAFIYVWTEQLKKWGSDSQVSDQIDPYTENIIQIMWKPLLDTFRTLILNPRTEKSSSLAVKGVQQLGILAGRHIKKPTEHLEQLLNVLVECLAFEEITSSPTGNQLPRYLARSDLFKALVKTFFELFRLNGEHFLSGWDIFVTHILYLTHSTVISLSSFEVTTTPASPSSCDTFGTQPQNSRRDIGLFSSLTQYLASTPTDENSIDPKIKSSATDFLRDSCKLADIIHDSRLFSQNCLLAFIDAFLKPLSLTSKPPLRWNNEIYVFLVDLTVHTAWCNRDRMSLFWDKLYSRFAEISKNMELPFVIREHAILGIGRLSLRLADHPSTQQEVVQFFQLLCHLQPELFSQLAEPALSIVLRIIELDPPLLQQNAIWPHYFTVLALAGRSRSCGPYTFGLLNNVVREDSVLFPLEFYSEYVDLVNGFISLSATPSVNHTEKLSASGEIIPSSVDLAVRALSIMVMLENHSRRQSLEWQEYIVPVHCALAQQCYHPLRPIRQNALSTLQRLLLSIDFHSTLAPLEYLIEEYNLVLLPLLEELQRPEMRKLGVGEIEEIQVRAVSMASRLLLLNLKILFPGSEVSLDLWSRLLSHMISILTIPSDLIRESVPETIKNMLLVMASSSVLRPSIETSNDPADLLLNGLWEITWASVGELLPGVQIEISEMYERFRPTPASSDAKVVEVIESIAAVEIVEESTLDVESEDASTEDLTVGNVSEPSKRSASLDSHIEPRSAPKPSSYEI